MTVYLVWYRDMYDEGVVAVYTDPDKAEKERKRQKDADIYYTWSVVPFEVTE